MLRAALLTLTLALSVAAVGCADPTKLTEKDLKVLCEAATEQTAKAPADDKTPNDMIGLVMKKGVSAGMKKMLAGDLITQSDKGKVISQWRERSGLTEYECAALEEIYPGATSHPKK